MRAAVARVGYQALYVPMLYRIGGVSAFLHILPLLLCCYILSLRTMRYTITRFASSLLCHLLAHVPPVFHRAGLAPSGSPPRLGVGLALVAPTARVGQSWRF